MKKEQTLVVLFNLRYLSFIETFQILELAGVRNVKQIFFSSRPHFSKSVGHQKGMMKEYENLIQKMGREGH